MFQAVLLCFTKIFHQCTRCTGGLFMLIKAQAGERINLEMRTKNFSRIMKLKPVSVLSADQCAGYICRIIPEWIIQRTDDLRRSNPVDFGAQRRQVNFRNKKFPRRNICPCKACRTVIRNHAHQIIV